MDAEVSAQGILQALEVDEPIKLQVEVIQSLGPLGAWRRFRSRTSVLWGHDLYNGHTP